MLSEISDICNSYFFGGGIHTGNIVDDQAT
jgi:hypothetical protein